MNPADPAELLAARMLMAFTLGTHIILVPLGVAFPFLVLIANFIGLKRKDPVALKLAQRWSHVMAVLFAVGAVSGTVLSFEMGLLWPGLTGIFGDVFGLPISLEGIFFFLEAIFISIYIFGWKRLSPWPHFWSGVVLPVVALGGVFSIISANGWMNMPTGFTLGSDGRPTDVDPIAAIFNPALGYEFWHMLAAAYMTAGFLVAGVFAMAKVHGHWDRYQRLAFAIPFTVAAIVAPLQMMIGDTVARTVFQEMPVKFAAIEIVWNTGPDQPEIILGELNQTTGVVNGGFPIPGLASWLSGFSTSTIITGLSGVPRDNQPPATIVHWAWDGMIFGGTGLALLATWYLLYWIIRRRLPGTAWFYRCAAVAGVLSVFCIECGWTVTEVGRQPWIVYNILRTADAVTTAGMVRPLFAVVLVIYGLIIVATVLTLRSMSRRWNAGEVVEPNIPYGPIIASSNGTTTPPATSPLASVGASEGEERP
ncbi:MAG: cytochrome ubiquinol oxidase subunit I [Chloroflexi bacterium]|nr:cytochrome ubiquinol oxidase subunit I [Chloroflexota bacterium]MBV9601564.1 cytochrome ubiquinol oxidase subunit I [Chloroflexota bacterium]